MEKIRELLEKLEEKMVLSVREDRREVMHWGNLRFEVFPGKIRVLEQYYDPMVDALDIRREVDAEYRYVVTPQAGVVHTGDIAGALSKILGVPVDMVEEVIE